jgi:CRISPR-associated protein Csx10
LEQLRVSITPKSPLCFSERRPGTQFRESLEYIPGAALRAAVAIPMREKQENAFDGLFTSEHAAVFANAYPAESVLPATAMSCKAQSGFCGDGKHGVIDTLVERLCFEALQPAGPLYLPRCPHCKPMMRMERHTAFYNWDGVKGKRASVKQRLLTRVAINRRRGTSEDELLYSPIVISEAARERDGKYRAVSFTGTVTASAHERVLQNYLEATTHLGSGTSRGLGRVDIRVELATQQDETRKKDLGNRIADFNDAIAEFWKLVQEQLAPCSGSPCHNPDKGRYFTIGLYADAVLKDEGWLPTAIFTAQMLKERCGVQDERLQLVRAYSAYDYRGGWNLAWGLPKDVDVVVPMGSVFVFWTADLERWVSNLLDLEQRGVGERTAEGFGQVRICDKFHVLATQEDPA